MKHFPSPVDHERIMVKDCDLKSFKKRFPDFGPLLDAMREFLPDGHKFYLVDLMVQDCQPGIQTCRDVRWHFDGDFNKDNKYALWAKGPNRTEFPRTMPELDQVPEDRESQNIFLENMGLDGLEVPDQTIVCYDSRTPHRGVVCRTTGRRIFVRMMASNYIKPKMVRNYAQV
jgi:hypothetical protein